MNAPAATVPALLPEPGIYFGMPEEQYHAAPAFSASGIKDILVSPLDFWARSWMNPERPEEKDSTAKLLGSAYHKAILEGIEAFEAAYAVKPEADEYPGVLKSGDELKAACKALGVKASGTLAEMSERIREADAVVPLWCEIVAEFEAAAEGKIHLTRAQWMEIRKAAFVMSRMPSAREIFTGGRSEVSIFWRIGDVPMKARIDYLKPKQIGDLKSFGNVMSKEVTEAASGEVTRNRYWTQPIVYTAAYVAARKMLAERGADVVHGEVDPEWLEAAFKVERPRFTFVFQQTGDVPNVVVRHFQQFERMGGLGQTTNAYWTKGESSVREGLRRFRHCMERFGPDVPWIVDHPAKAFSDEDFPIYALNLTPEMEIAA